jgi:hypothetical protein
MALSGKSDQLPNASVQRHAQYNHCDEVASEIGLRPLRPLAVD